MNGPLRPAALGVIALLGLTGCMTLVDADPGPAAPVQTQSTPAMPQRTFEPLTPNPARSSRTTDAKLESLTGRLAKGGAGLDFLVPGTGSMVLEERFTGPVEFALPRGPETGSTLVISVSCLPADSRFTAMTLDEEMNSHNAVGGLCAETSSIGGGGENGLTNRIRVIVHDDVEVLLGVARGESAPFS